MSGKGLKSLKDDNQELQKQIGCITGFFQLFDRHRFLTTQHTSSSSNHIHIQHTPSSGGSNDDIKELNCTMQKTKAKNLKIARAKQQFSRESSITSVSSPSCSSSMSSLESPSTSKIRIPQNPHSQAVAPMKRHDAPGQQSLDFYDIVKDSMHRESQRLLSVKTLAKMESNNQTYASKRVDSPRPLQSHNKAVNAGVMVTNEPIHILSKSKRTPWDSPRLSYDGRYTQEYTLKSTTKHKELPRLSLDSRERSIRGVNEGNKARNLLTGPQKGYGKNSSTMLNQLQQEPETSKRSSSSVVAKLMGLDALPDWTQPRETPQKKELLESSSKSSQLQDSKGSDSDVKSSSKSSLSVYGEIEKRLAELEFKKSGKDLRALKQILEAMQRYQDSSSGNRNNTTSLSEGSKVQSPRIQQKDPVSVTIESSNSTKGSKLPIVIMKPARVTRKANNPPSKGVSSTTTKNIKDPFGQPVSSAGKSNSLRTSKVMQSSKVPQVSIGKNTTNSGNKTVTGSPRLQKKFGMERRSPPTSPSSDSSINNRRQHNRQPLELSSSSTASRQNFSIVHDRNERFNEISCDWRNFKHHVNVISSDFDSNRSFVQNDTFQELRMESSKAEKIIAAEQPSPVSVLDAAFYREEPPSPVKKKPNISKNLGEALSTDDDSDRDMDTQNLAQIFEEIDWIDEKLLNLNNTKYPDHKYISEILLASGLLSGQNFIHILHSTGHLISPKLFFALEQMKTINRNFNIEDSAKEISRTISPEQIHRKLIFDVVNDILVQKLILESSSTLWCLPKDLAEDRKLKGKQLLEELCTEIDQLQPQNRNVSFVCEDDNFTSLLSEDLKHHHPIWTNCRSEIPNVELDIERLIFKDLITEVVRDELANHFGSHCRQLLFPK